MASLDTTSTLNGGSIVVTIYEDTGSDGIADNIEEVTLTGGTESTQLSNISNTDTNDHWIHVAMEPGSETTRPELSDATLTFVTQVNIIASGSGDGAGSAALSPLRGLIGSGSGSGTGSGLLESITSLVASGLGSGTGSASIGIIRALSASGTGSGTGSAALKGIKVIVTGIKKAVDNGKKIFFGTLGSE